MVAFFVVLVVASVVVVDAFVEIVVVVVDAFVEIVVVVVVAEVAVVVFVALVSVGLKASLLLSLPLSLPSPCVAAVWKSCDVPSRNVVACLVCFVVVLRVMSCFCSW